MQKEIVLPNGWSIDKIEGNKIILKEESDIIQLTPNCQMKVVASNVNWYEAKKLEKENPGWRLPSRKDFIEYEREIHNYFKQDGYISIWFNDEYFLSNNHAWTFNCGYDSCYLNWDDKDCQNGTFKAILIKD